MNEPTQKAGAEIEGPDISASPAAGGGADGGSERETLQGTDVDLAGLDAAARAEFFEKAFDYRGDVTLQLEDGRTIEGYLFDRHGSGEEGEVRIWPRDADQRMTVPSDQIIKISFTGRDPAAGRSWEHWVKKYHEKKAKGEEASIYADPLDED